MANRRDVLRGTLATGAVLGMPLGAPAGAPRAEAVARRRIPRTGELVPCVGMGTWQTFDVDPAGELADQVAVMRAFLDGGGALIDSSPMYGRAEEVVGRVLAQLGREDLFLASKVWTDEGREAGIAQMEASGRLMGGGRRLDLLQVHNLVGYGTHLKTLRAWKAEGRVRYIGATEMQDWKEVERILGEDGLDFVQVPYSMADRAVEARVLPAALDHGVAVLVMRPFQEGGLFNKVKGKSLPGWAAELGCTGWAQVFLKWILGHPAVTCPIPATSKPHHMTDNLRAGIGPLPDEPLRKRMLAELGL